MLLLRRFDVVISVLIEYNPSGWFGAADSKSWDNLTDYLSTRTNMRIETTDYKSLCDGYDVGQQIFNNI